MLRPDLCPSLLPSLALLLAAAPVACTTFVEGESSSAGLSTSDGSTTAGTGESESAGTTASTASTGSAGSTSATGSTSMTTTMTTTLTTTAGTTVDPTTAGPTSDPSTTEPVTTSDGTEPTTEPPPSCDNAVKDGAETDVDCGGGTCPLCQVDQTCLANGDCASGLCEGTCTQTPQSCADILAEKPDAADGIHTIYPGGAPLEIKCDMLGGGWTCVYANDFSDNAEGWSNPALEDCDGDQILGRLFNKAETARDFDLLGVPHAEIRVTGNLYVIDSWDSEKVTIRVDNTEIWSKSCNINNCGQNDNLCGAFWDDVILPITAIGMHKEAKATVRFTTNLSEGKDNESYGVDDIEVCVK